MGSPQLWHSSREPEPTRLRLEYGCDQHPRETSPNPCVKLGFAKSIHQARVYIRQRHIRVGKQLVDIPSFMVRVENQKLIDFSYTSPFGGGRPGRNKRKSLARKAGGGNDEDDE